MIRGRYHGENTWDRILGINHSFQLRIQLCLILRRLGLPRDLRQLLIKRVWFNCQSEVLRQERISLISKDRPKFVLPILEQVEKCRARYCYGRLGRTVLGARWNRLLLTTMEMVMANMDDFNNFPSIVQLRKRKKLKI